MLAKFITNNTHICRYLENNGIEPLETRKYSCVYNMTNKVAFLVAHCMVHKKVTVIYHNPVKGY